MKLFRKYRVVVLIIMDILIICTAYLFSTFLLTDNMTMLTAKNRELISNTIILSLFMQQILFSAFNVYRNITRYENGEDYIIYILLSAFSGIMVFLIGFLFELPILGFRQIALSAILIAVGIVSYRVIIRTILTATVKVNEKKEKKNLLIIGAGEAGKEIIKTVKTTMRGTYNVVGLIDDNPNKKGYVISGVKILGDRHKIIQVCKEKKVDTIFFSISSIDNVNKMNILNICQETGIKLRVLPGVADIINNKTLVQNLRNVEIEDILGRQPIKLDNRNITEFIKNETILVTGGGGSIGSELCRQIVKYEPKTLVIFDIYENNLYNIQMELKQKHYNEKINIVSIIGSVRDKKRLEKVFEEYKPSLIFHAAAHKHVPLMETSPLEAIKNNVFGTYNVANYAEKYEAKRFVLISTDKAVNPTNIMGATKRICEMIVQAKNKESKTEFAAVRFGNVLGSNGSVVPLFRKQITSGGPLTVTHKEITRFFMTIPEAVALVLQAMSYAKGGEIFVLDMGEPVQIYDLAVSLIKLSGLEPNVDIPIKITGLRPGEKLYEELLMAEEGLLQTEHEKIFIGKLSDITEKELKEKLSKLEQITKNEEIKLEEIKQVMKQVVPTYHEPEEVNIEIKDSKKELIERSKVKDLIKKIEKTKELTTSEV